jgi:hypothetical protein
MKKQLTALLLCASSFSYAAPPLVEVWRSPTCGCCKDWVTHLEQNGFAVKVSEVPDTAGKRAELGIPAELGSCHSARVDGYALEGHVPASEIKRLLKEQPKAVGLTVPGMPLGSPGMDGEAYRGVKHEYKVLLIDKKGSYRTYRHYAGNQ